MFNKEETVSLLVELFSINSPTGYTKNAVDFLRKTIEKIGHKTETTPKGNLIVQVDGEDANQTRGLSAHVDTLGLMVRSINRDRKSTRLNSSHVAISYAVFCLKKITKKNTL